MKKLIATTYLAALLFSSQAFADMKEEVIKFQVNGQNVVGTLTLPAGKPAPVVLLFHGFTGTRNELPVTNTKEGVFQRTARMLAEKGLASLRVDFRGSGESTDMMFADTTFESQIADGIAAVSFAEADPRVDGQKLSIIGWSQGGLVASAVAGRTNKPDVVVLWNAVATPKDTFGGILGADTMKAGMTTGTTPLNIKLPWGAEIALKQGFFDSVNSFDPASEIAAYKGPLLVAQGSEDTTVAPASADKFLDKHEGVEAKWTEKMDHVFNVFTGPETLDKMIGATAEFVTANMK
jgi:uncharacterized protein